ncbi:hypothetical protein ES703_15280 [subsurface metagenome]
MTRSQDQKPGIKSDDKPYLLVQYPSQGRPVFKFLNIKNPRFTNPGSRSNGSENPVHISKVIEEAMSFILTYDTLRRQLDIMRL